MHQGAWMRAKVPTAHERIFAMTRLAATDASLNPKLTSWVTSANDPISDFPIQNLPFGRFRIAGHAEWRVGVAIGTMVLDLRATGLVQFSDMNQLISLGREPRQALRAALSAGLALGSAQQAHWSRHLYNMAELELGLPCDTTDYTDFYVGIHHATAVGKLFRPDAPLLPNYKCLPIGYHGRASTLNASGGLVIRPKGQIKSNADDSPTLAPTERLDLELELGVVIGRSNLQGQPIPMQEAEDHVFGITLLNDWSARDIQAWEYQPLGPFLSKNFATTVSPWMVTLEALSPFRRAYERPPSDPPLLPYLDAPLNRTEGAFDIDLEVLLQTAGMRAAGQAAQVISRSNFADAAYWTVAQMVSHHTVNGCRLSEGDLLGTGTLSGPKPTQAGSLLELSQGGKAPFTLANGEERTFLQDGDSITLRASCNKPGYRRIGFGECTATVAGQR
jgi:fumarylacetoacetase